MSSAAGLAAIGIARARARLAVEVAIADHNERLLSIFRDEIGRCVTKVCAFLWTLLENEGYVFDEVAWSLGPPRGWPFAQAAKSHAGRHAFRYAGAAAISNSPLLAVGRTGNGIVLPLKDNGRARVRVVGDTLGVVACMGRLRLASEDGRLKIAVPWLIPRRFIVACIGKPVSDVLDIPVMMDRDWTIIAVQRSSATAGFPLIVDVGSRPYLCPWSRPSRRPQTD